MRNHTATHVLHRALRNTVGERARQAGSLVTPDYLRFDFPLDRPLTDDEQRAIETEVRGVVRDNRTVTPHVMTMAEASSSRRRRVLRRESTRAGARHVRRRLLSRELCGGTHCAATGQIGSFVITGERSIGSGMRRIEALTGDTARTSTWQRGLAAARARGRSGRRTRPDALPARIAELQSRSRELERRPRATARPLAGGAGAQRPGRSATRVRGPLGARSTR